jgi:hypothetical protein
MSTLSDVREFDSSRWAAEEVAIDLGWLRECPYHGEPFRVPDQYPRELETPGVPTELAAVAMELRDVYDEQCAYCALESTVPE